MTATAHTLVAGAIATAFPTNPLAAAGLTVISHFVMDSVPHWDFGTNWRNRSKSKTGAIAITETLFGLTLSAWIFGSRVPTITLSVALVASLLPDWLETPWYIFFANQKKHEPKATAGPLERLTYRVYKVQNRFHTKTYNPLFGILTQVIVVGFFWMLVGLVA